MGGGRAIRSCGGGHTRGHLVGGGRGPSPVGDVHAYAVTSGPVREVLVWLADVDPTTNGPNFERRHPADVDPVSGTPGEVYRSVEG